MKILLTGATGLIGSHVVRMLAENGHTVLAVDVKSGDVPATVELRTGDISDIGFISEVCQDVEAVIHLGAIPRPYPDADDKVFSNNVLGAYRVFASAVTAGVKVVAYASSLSIYGTAWSPQPTSPMYVPMDEDHPLVHFDSYALTKEINERSAQMWGNRSDTSFIGFRFPFCNTENEIVNFATKMFQGDIDKLTEGAKILWNYLDVRDASAALLLSIMKPKQGSHVYNFAAPDTMAPRPTEEMLAEFHPTTKVIRPILGYSSLLDQSAWDRDYGFKPKFLLNRNNLRNR
jgi:nucleoside-diphosphate-sugar epimerase